MLECTVADAVDFVDDGLLGISRKQEEGVQRVHLESTALHGARRRHQTLSHHLAAKDAPSTSRPPQTLASVKVAIQFYPPPHIP